ncbi:MAG TPA: prepilin peptidase [Terriglobales bacterium]|nr:prepilin peptidase [Terriglobales bacterium]
MDRYLELSAVVMTAIAAITDLRARRIPNWLTYSGLLLAVSARTAFWGWSGLKTGLAGVVVAGSIFCLLSFFGAMGGGDVKLMGAVGAWLGPSNALLTLIVVCITGGFIAFAYLLFGSDKPIAANIAREGKLDSSASRPVRANAPNAARVPFGVAIAIGTFVCAGSAFFRR